MFREDQDRFGSRSHAMADQAAKAGHLSDIVPVQAELFIQFQLDRIQVNFDRFKVHAPNPDCV